MTDAGGSGSDAVRPSTLAKAVPVPAAPPLVTEIRRLLAEGKEREAVLVAYLTAEEHLRQVYRIQLPRQWTHREFLQRYVRADMGPAGELVTRLHQQFEPVRYGRPDPVSIGGLLDLVQALYREPPLRSPHLYTPSRIVSTATGSSVGWPPSSAPQGE